MQVIKRSGKKEDVSFDKITARVKKLCYNLDTRYVNYIEISKKVIMKVLYEFQRLFHGIRNLLKKK